MSVDNIAAEIKGKLTDELNRINITVMWLTGLIEEKKISSILILDMNMK